MSNIDYDQLSGGAGGDPPPGLHNATLVRAKLALGTSSGDWLITEWQITGLTPYFWTVWHGFEGQKLSFTQDFLDALGVDRAQIMKGDSQDERDVNFQAALDDVVNRDYQVEIKAWSGGINTYVTGPAQAPDQTSLDELGTDTTDLPPAMPVTVPDDDDKPPF
jgi:hypothetical protein